MAKIATHIYKRYKVDVTYQAKNGRFHIKLPEEMAGYANDNNGTISAEKQHDVERMFEKIADQYIAEKAERIKFIAIESGGHEDSTFVQDEFYRAGGESGFLHLQWAIVTRVKINGTYLYKYQEKPCSNLSRERDFWVGHNVIYIEWTEKREQFLRNATNAVKELAGKVHDFVAAEDLEKKIDSGKMSLLLTDRSKE